MSKKTAALLTKLSTDAGTRKAFKANPDKVMDEHGLSAEDKAVLKSGDADKIREHLGDDAPPGCMVLII
jgi:hypothetical protein